METLWRISDDADAVDQAVWDLLAEVGGDPLFHEKDAATAYLKQVLGYVKAAMKDDLYRDRALAEAYIEAHTEMVVQGRIPVEIGHVRAARVAAAAVWGQPLDGWKKKLRVKRVRIENAPPPEPPADTDELGVALDGDR